MDAPSLQTLASHWLCHSSKEGQTGCQSDKDYVWCRLLDRSQACCQQTQPAHSACTTTIRQEGAKEIECLQTETRQQEASFRQWSLQPFRCTGTHFRRCRWELDSLQRHCSFFSNGFPRTSISQTPRLVWWERQRNPGTPWRETLKNTRLTSEIPAQHLVRQPIQTYARQYRLGSETCKTPGWAKRLMKSSPLQTERIWRSSLTHSPIYGPQSSEITPLLSADGTSLLTEKEVILKRWAEHFDGVLNRPSSINDDAINRLPQVECYPLLDELPTVSETVKAIKKTLVIWQGSRIWCNTCRDLQSRRSSSCRETDRVISHYVEKRSHPSRIQGCNNYPPFQKERESSSLWQSSRHLFFVNSWEDPC